MKNNGFGFRLFALITALFLLPWLFPSRPSEVAASAEAIVFDQTVVLDAGHGGEDGGAIGIRTLTREKDINLDIVLYLARLFENAGAAVVLTRNSDDSLCRGDYSKREDMAARAEIVERCRPAFVISVHCNSFPTSSSVQGAQTFCFPGSESGRILAERIQHSLLRDLGSKRTVKEEDFFMLRLRGPVCVLVECGFLSNPEEEALLCRAEYRQKLAYSIFDGVCAFLYGE